MKTISSFITDPGAIFQIPFIIMQESMDFAVMAMEFGMRIARISI